MNTFLKREAAPLSKEVWKEIDETAVDVIKNMLTTRRVLKVHGPYGLDYTSVDEGRLKAVETNGLGEVSAGNYAVQPLLEARIPFRLQRWEIDNVDRGAEDVDFGPLEDAVEKLALFEESAVYNGYPDGIIEGIIPTAENTINFGKTADEILRAIDDAIFTLHGAYFDPPHDLVVSKEFYERLNSIYEGAYLKDYVSKLIGGDIWVSKVIDGGILLPHREEDLEFTVGQDFAIGYEQEVEDEVQLFATVSFTFRMLDEEAAVVFTDGEKTTKKTTKSSK